MKTILTPRVRVLNIYLQLCSKHRFPKLMTFLFLNAETTVSSGVGSLSFMHETISNISPVVHKDQHSESFEAVASTHSHPTGILPLIEFGGQSPVVIGPQKGKEVK